MPLFNPKNERERQQEAIIQERNRMILERRVAPILFKEFNRVARKAAKVDAKLTKIITEHKKNLVKILTPMYQTAISGAAKRTIAEAPKGTVWKFEKKDILDDIDSLITRWVMVNSFMVASDISDTTRELIATAIINNVGAGEAVMGKAIMNAVGGAVGAGRSKMIARTETHDASQEAQLETVNHMEFPPDFKQWVSIKDSRTRDDHRAADKQTVDRKAKFKIGSDRMKRPGDRRGGGPEQTINCRCVMIFTDRQ